VLLPSWCLFISVAWCISSPKAKLSGVELLRHLLSYIYPDYPLRTKICFGFNYFVGPSLVSCFLLDPGEHCDSGSEKSHKPRVFHSFLKILFIPNINKSPSTQLFSSLGLELNRHRSSSICSLHLC